MATPRPGNASLLAVGGALLAQSVGFSSRRLSSDARVRQSGSAQNHLRVIT